MADDDTCWDAVRREIAVREEVDKLLFDLSTLHRRKDVDTEEYQASEGWCFGVKLLSSKREPRSDIWEYEFEMASFLCDALGAPHGTTFSTQHSEKTRFAADGRALPEMYGVVKTDLDVIAAHLLQHPESLEQARVVALMNANWL